MEKLRKLRSKSPMLVENRKSDIAVLSSSSSTASIPPQQNITQKKKKRPFFHRHRDRSKSKSSDYLTSSLSDQKSFLTPTPDSSLSQPYPLRKDESIYSSNSSLLSVESELSDEELVESLVNPGGSRKTSQVEPSPVSQPLSRGKDVCSVIPQRNLKRNASSLEYLVKITLMSGHGLAIRDKTGSSDPYVKFKCPPFKYRSAVIHRNLNPEWNETFSFRTQRLDIPMLIRVYDYDFGSLDDFMGGQTLDLSSFVQGSQHTIDLGLVDHSLQRIENLGFLRLVVKIVPFTETEMVDGPQEEKKTKSSSISSEIWDSVLSVTLLEGTDLPAMDLNGLSDPYCKFKLGSQKFKSKVLSKTLNPKWMQRFDLRMYNDGCSTLHVEVWDKDFPQNDDYMGGCFVNLDTLTKEVTHTISLPLMREEGCEGNIHFTLCITGTKVEEQTSKNMNTIKYYGLLGSFNLKAIKERNVGHLRIKIDKVIDLVPCSSYVLVKLGNSCVRTHKIGKTSNPIWDKIFDFTVRDVHDELELQVHKSGSRSILGMVKVPLLRLREGTQQFALKDKHSTSRARGIIYIETEFVYNPLRAMIRTVNPKETELLEVEQKLRKKILMGNIKRVTNLVRTCLATVEFIKSTWTWENKALSGVAFLIFLFVTLFGQLWWLFAGGVAVFMYQYVAIYLKNGHVWQNRVSKNIHNLSSIQQANSLDSNDSDFSDIEDEKSTSIVVKFRQFQEVLILVQNVLGYVGDLEEEIRNLLDWHVPFLGWMAVIVFMGATILFFLVPLRYIILIWGINKYTKKLRKPNFISNNELLDFLSRCPTNADLEKWQEIPMAVFSGGKKQH